MGGNHKQKTDPIKHCQVDEIRICTLLAVHSIYRHILNLVNQ